MESDDWYIDAELVLKARAAGLRIAELPVEFMRNDQRASLVKPSAIWEFLVNMARSLRRSVKTVLVTGAAGSLGRLVVEQLPRHRVRALVQRRPAGDEVAQADLASARGSRRPSTACRPSCTSPA